MAIYVYTDEPEVKMIECDFTEWDQGFVFNRRNSSGASYWIDQNWLYVTASSAERMVSWLIPTNIYSLWEIKKIVLFFNCSTTQAWWWIARKNGDSYTLRTRSDRIEIVWYWNNNTSVTNPSWDYEYTIDFENKKSFISTAPTTTLTLSDGEITSIMSDITSWNMCICWMLKQAWTVHINKVQFYYL